MTSYSAMGKQVLHNDTHFADACDPDAAARIMEALNGQMQPEIARAKAQKLVNAILDKIEESQGDLMANNLLSTVAELHASDWEYQIVMRMRGHHSVVFTGMKEV